MDPQALENLKQTLCYPMLKKVGLHPHHGFVLMLSSIFSKNSCGYGEFLDLLPMIKWAKSIGFDFFQLLPINDSGLDNSPYNPISTFALNPVYISLHALKYVNDDQELKTLLEKYQNSSRSQYFDYSRARKEKFIFLKLYKEKYFSKISKEPSYKAFVKKYSWVKEYALFNALCEDQECHNWHKWPSNLKKLSTAKKTTLFKKFENEINFHILHQYLCFKQFHQVKEFADKTKFSILGDLPFLVSKFSFDAWFFDKLFLMDYSVGSPPDDLTPNGQDWDFPAYNWDELIKSDYEWWKLRLKVSQEFYHIYRLDHIIGFYRTWNVPKGKLSKDGAFCPSDPKVWLEHGRRFLKMMIKNSNMLPIGEDLVIPQTIKDSMKDLGICGTSILTWQRAGSGGLDFIPYPLYVNASITHIASHDTVTLAQWWKKFPKTCKQFCLWNGWKYTKELDHEKRFKILKASHSTSSLFHASLLQEYLALFPKLVDKDHNKERINYPGTPSKGNWRYRFKISVEEITAHSKLKEQLKKILT